MRVAKLLLVVAVVLAVASAANAATQVWWTAEANPQYPNSSVLPGAGPGQKLNLVCDKTIPDGRCEWLVQMHMDNDTMIAAWANDLVTDDDSGKLWVKDWGYSAVFGGYMNWPFGTVYDKAPGSDPGDLLIGAGGLELAGIQPGWDNFPPDPARPPGDDHIFWFLLSAWKDIGPIGTIEIRAPIGALEWGGEGSPAGYPYVQFGGNDVIEATDVNNDQLGAVINVINIPEPATLALLGFGALALIRRRR